MSTPPNTNDAPGQLTTADIEQIKAWNSNRETETLHLCLHDVLHQQAVRTPSRPALCSWDGDMDYAHLDQLSTRLAHWLVSDRGLKVEDIVAFTFEKSSVAVVTMIAVMKAGGVVMPLDPRMPQGAWHERIHQFDAKTAVTSSTFASRFPSSISGRCFIIDADFLETLPDLTHQPCSDVRPHNGALLAFTSGSTGKPKGILQEHYALSTSCRDHGAAMRITSESRTYQFSSYAFDTAVGDMFCTFLVGGCVCLPSDTDRVNNLAASITQLGANLACLTPSAADSLSPEEVPTLKVLCLGGETLTERLVKKWASVVQLINIYGVTECIIWCVATEPIRPGDKPSNIGRAACGTTWIVDQADHTKLVPIGEVGELLIQGPNMARHYVQNPQATEKAFVYLPPFLSSADTDSLCRFYRTGDLAKYASDGSIEYLGRRDTQVKFAGQRIDLSYIEYHMEKCVPSHVEVCVVVAAHQRVLAGFLADNRSASEYNPSDIKAQLSHQLPSYMVPGIIIPLSRMPTTATGKLDRQRLSKMASESMTNMPLALATRQCSEAEESLRNLWASALDVSPTVLHPQSIFLQYGDSVSAIKLSSLARKSGIALDMATIFMHPTLSDMALHLESAATNMLEVTAFSLIEPETLNMAVREAALQCGLGVEDIEDLYPCTPLQEGLMALSMKQKGEYISRYILPLNPSVDLSTLKSAWKTVIDYNPILRTRLVQFNNQTLQAVIASQFDWTIEKDLEAYLKTDFAIRSGYGEALISSALVQNAGDCVLVLTMHHSIYDGWSIYRIQEQIEKAYRGQLQQPSIHFRSFISSLLSSNQESSASYWRGQLQDAPDIAFPPISSSNRTPSANSVQAHNFVLPVVPTSEITTSTFVRAAWAILISQHCLSDDVVIGTTLSGRSMPLAGINELVGPTITTLPVRIRLLGSQMVESFLRQLQDQATDMIPHEHFGLRNIRKLGPDIEAASNFQSLLILQPPVSLVEGDVFEQRDIEMIEQTGTFVLTLQVRLEGQQVELVGNFDETMLDGRYVSWLLHQMEHIMKQLYENPFTLLQDIKAFCPNDETQIAQWLPDMDFVDRCVQDVFADRVQETPDSCAIFAWDGEVTYKELDDMSNRLAWHIYGLGIRPGDRVPLLFEKSLWTQIALFGVIKAGATFVLIDPDHPSIRIQGIFDDVEAKLTLSSVQYESASHGFGVSVLVVDKSLIEQLPSMEGKLPVEISPRQELYIHFSSGTTGKPKGSIIEHCSYSSSAAATCKATEFYPGPESANRVLHFASHSYDMCIEEILATLMHGGVLCIPSDFERNNDVIGSINKYNCTRANFTPSFGRLIAPSDVPGLRVVTIGGEAIAEQDIAHWNGVKLFNAYGPSEAAVTSCVKEWPTINSTTDFRSIGHPIESGHFFLVEPGNHHQRTPLGGLGEIVIDSPTVARQYLKEAEKSKKAFVDRPAWLSGEGTPAGRKLYKTGDIGRYSADGEIIFLGRRDTQVKLRGQRLELSEVEYHVSSQLASVDEVVADVITIASLPNPVLAAFIRLGSKQCQGDMIDEFAASGQSWVALQDRITNHLGKVVPGYMIPTVFFPMRRIPLTNSHKVDRKVLREACVNLTTEQLASFSSTLENKRAPTTRLELAMSTIWSDILGINKDLIGAEDNFFQLGGDSIDAMKLVAICRSQGLSLTMATSFQHPCLADMCLALTETIQDSSKDLDEVEPFSLLSEHETEALRKEAGFQCCLSLDLIEDIYPTTPLQEGLLAISAKRPGMEMAQMSFPLDAQVDVERLKMAWESVVHQTPILRTRMIATKSGTFQVVTNEQIEWISANNLQKYVKHDREMPMLNGDKLCRLAMITEAGSEKAHICITMHHALYDGWSWARLIESVEKVYAGVTITPSVPFNHFVRFLMTLNLNSKRAAKEHWSSVLAGTSADIFPKLPDAFYSPQSDSCIKKMVLGKNLSHVTLANVIRAAWALLISRYTENSDVVFGSVVTGRDAPVEGIDGLVGPTFTTIPVRVQVDANLTIGAYLQQVQAQSGSTDSFEHIGLQRIRNINSDTKIACSFQNVLVVQPEEEDVSQQGILNERQDLDEMGTFNNYGLMLECTPSRDGIHINASFDSNMVTEFQMSRILDQLAHVLRQLLSREEKQLRDVDMLCPEDYELIRQWNQKTPEIPEQCMHTAIKVRAEQQPKAEAVCAWDGSFSYEEVMALSSRLATHLHELGARPNTVIPIAFEKSKWTIISMIAVSMSGAAFVLLDTAHYDQERLISLSRDVDAEIIVASPTYAPYYDENWKKVVTLSSEFVQMLPADSGLPDHLYHHDNYFCVMFTSGSTGKPKAIIHSHAGLYASYEAFGSALVLNSETRVFQFASNSFDPAIIDPFSTLMHGGCVCIPSEKERIDDFYGAFHRLQANWVHLTPSLGRSLNPDKLPGLKNILLGGEPLMQTELNVWSEKAHLMSAYGPAESSLCISGTLKKGVRSPPNLGWPVACRAWVVEVSDYTKLAPVGMIGHLIIEGPVNALCYMNDAEKTAAGFISPQHVWMPEVASPVNQRMFRTGDLVRYTPNGTVEFVERRDTQIKLRGQRIELSEVEFHLKEALKQSGYDVESIVAKITPSESSSLLAAFIESHELSTGCQEKNDDIIGQLLESVTVHMKSKLVAYKIPTVLIPVATIPRTPSQKIDRKELLRIASKLSEKEIASRTCSSRVGRAPITEAEKHICSLFARVLELREEQVFADDMFSRLGGDSIQGMRLVALAREEGVVITVSQLFSSSSVTELASQLPSPAATFVEHQQPASRQSALFHLAADQCNVSTNCIEDVYPCTPLQEGLMSLSLEKDNAYVAHNVFQLPPDVEVERLKQAWAEVSARNPILRMRMISLQGRSLLVVVQEEFSWRTGNSLKDGIDEEKRLTMGLGSPLNHFCLVGSDEGNFLLWTSHHSTYDGWSMKLLIDQVGAAYHGRTLPMSTAFRNFALDLESRHLDSSAFWARMTNVSPIQTFPEKPLPGVRPKANLTASRQFNLNRRTGSPITTSVILRAAWALTLRQHCDAGAVSFGTVSFGRNSDFPGIEGIVGPTFCTYPVITQVEPNLSVLSFLEAQQAAWLEALPHEHFGLQNIAKLNNFCKEACDFQNLLLIQPKQLREAESTDVMGTWLQSTEYSEFFSYPLTIECSLSETGCDVLAGWDEDLIEKNVVENMLSQFDSMVQQLLTEEPTQTIGQLDMLGASGLEQIRSWNKLCIELQAPYTEENDMPVHIRIAKRAQENPHAEAVCARDASLTYAEVQRYSDALAAYLVLQGVGPEVLVPFCFEKSAWTVVTMLAISKAGGAFVPLEGSYPLPAKTVEVSRKFLDALPESTVQQNVKLADAAYVIFTSGSTGTPKGVIMEHGAFSRGVTDHGYILRLGAASRALNFASDVFDASITETITTLVHGGCVCVPSAAERTGDLVSAMTRMKVNWAFFTTSFLYTLSSENLPHLETIVVGGEPISAEIFQAWADKVCLIEGPTNIGRATSGHCWIVDAQDHNQLASIGSVGELLIEAPTLARGYLNDPTKTAAVFVEDLAWAAATGTVPRRMYKTGDLAKYNHDGTIEFVGRKDTQVKLRGQRVELTLIEHHVRKVLPDLVHVAVEVITTASDKIQLLAAFLEFKDSTTDMHLSGELRSTLIEAQRNLSKQIPRHMIPSLFLPLAAMPLSASGKINRRELRNKGANLSKQQIALFSLTANDKRPPSTKNESTLQLFWADLLRIPIDSIGIDDGFYQLGGDSILAMRLATLAREQGLDLNVQTILKSSSLSEMASLAHAIHEHEEYSIKPFALVDGCEKLQEQLETLHNIDGTLIEDAYACTPLQEGLVALSARYSGTYVAQFVFKLHPFIDLARFKQCWESLVCRHAILRTVIANVDGTSLQLVQKPFSISWLAHFSLSEYLDEDRASPMDTMQHLARYGIVSDRDGQIFFVWTAHHAIYDGWTVDLLFSELKQMYNGTLITSLPPVQPFAKVAKYVSSLDADNSAQYWRDQLTDKDHAVFPDTSLSKEDPIANATYTHTITMSRTHNSTVAMSTLIRSACAVVLSSYANSKDIVFGEILSGRDIPVSGVASIAGPLITTVPVSVSLDFEQRTSRFLKQMQVQAADMIPHQYFGLQKIRQLGPECSSASNFTTLLVIQPANESADVVEMWEQEEAATATSGFLNYPLVLEAALTSSGLKLNILHATSILSREQVDRIAHQFEHVLRQLSDGERSEATLADTDVFSLRDKQDLSAWNGDQLSTFSTTIHSMVGNRVALQGDSIAVYAKQTSLSFNELDVLSTKLMHHLAKLGVKRGERVPLLFRKSPWMIVAALAVLKIGAAYIPLDPKFPKSRNDYVVRKVSAKVLLVGDGCEGFRDDEVLVNQNTCEGYEIENAVWALREGDPSDAACIIFTSGTTGQPKGVILSHASLCSSIRSIVSRMNMNRQSRVLQFAGYIFDASILEIWGTLMCGATVCIPDETDRLNRLAGVINEMDVNWMFLTPTVASMLAPYDVPTLRTLVLGGEKLTKEVIDRWSTHVHLINGYGPAETSIFTACTGPLSPLSNPENIGRGVGSRIWIVDPKDPARLTPPGGVGEILVEGPGVSNGYVGEPEKTAAVFIERPSWHKNMMLDLVSPACRMYRTGDLGHFDSEGNIHIVGRRDNQVKIHGQRVELGDVEMALLASLPQGWRAIAGEREARITAFILRGGEETGDGARLVSGTEETKKLALSLRRKVGTLLPAYMIPSEFVLVSPVPLTAGGKVDRQAVLRLGDRIESQHLLDYDEAIEAPRTANERMLQCIWASVLQVKEEEIGIHSNFIHLGADSIAAMRLVQAVRAAGHALSVQEIFTSPLLCDMAQRVESGEKDKEKQKQQTESQDNEDDQATCLKGLYATAEIAADNVAKVCAATDYQSYALASGHLRTRGYNNYLVYDIAGPLDVARLHRACQQVVDQHEILRTVFVVRERQLVQVVLKHMSARIEYPSRVEGLSTLISDDGNEEMKLASSPVKFMIMRQAGDRNRLVMRISHAQYDGISLPILLDDLSAAYAGRRMHSSLPFSSFVRSECERQQLDGSDGAAAAQQHWKECLAGARMAEIVVHKGPSYRYAMDATKTHTVSPHMQGLPYTFATVLQTAWALVLAELGGRNDVVFGYIASGRSTLTGGTVVGPCMNILPMRIRVPVSAHDAPLDTEPFLSQVQSQYLANIPFEHYGFRHVIEACTDWPPWTRFSSVVQHNNLPAWPASSAKQQQPDGTVWHFSSYTPPHDAADVWVSSTPSPTGRGFTVNLDYSHQAMPDGVASTMLELLCRYIETLTSAADPPAPRRAPLQVLPTLPLEHKTWTPPDSPPVNEGPSDPYKLVNTVWDTVLGVDSAIDGNTPFFEIWGDAILAAACLSEQYRRMGLAVSTENVIDRPTKRLQVLMLGGEIDHPYPSSRMRHHDDDTEELQQELREATSKEHRRRLQNRIAQRNHRKRVRQQQQQDRQEQGNLRSRLQQKTQQQQTQEQEDDREGHKQTPGEASDKQQQQPHPPDSDLQHEDCDAVISQTYSRHHLDVEDEPDPDSNALEFDLFNTTDATHPLPSTVELPLPPPLSISLSLAMDRLSKRDSRRMSTTSSFCASCGAVDNMIDPSLLLDVPMSPGRGRQNDWQVVGSPMVFDDSLVDHNFIPTTTQTNIDANGSAGSVSSHLSSASDVSGGGGGAGSGLSSRRHNHRHCSTSPASYKTSSKSSNSSNSPPSPSPSHLHNRPSASSSTPAATPTSRYINLKAGTSSDWTTPLHIAVEKGHEKLVRLLLMQGGNVNEKDAKGSTVLHKAASRGTGATGYIGGDILYQLYNTHPEYAYSALVRTKEKAKSVTDAFPDVRIVIGSLDDSDILKEEASKADVVIHTADASDHVGAAKAIAAGLASSHSATNPGFWLHTGGTGILCWETMRSDERLGEESSRQYDDWTGIADLIGLPSDAFHKNVDDIVLSSNSDAVKTAIVCPPTIYGRGRGPVNSRSRQAYELAKLILTGGYIPIVGQGKARWNAIHVQDLANVFVLLAEAAVSKNENKGLWNDKGYFLVENGEFFWADLARLMGRRAVKLGLVGDGKALEEKNLGKDKAIEQAGFEAVSWGYNSRGKAERARKVLGWEPKKGKIEDWVDEILEDEKARL
ncbi:non-ribosomal peptide synthetase [Curvularia clavata]|uniref:Non-ribosomal peptide synthetase n=1 Tax=Curvularia clavata TaxID=95742 RepID=A0A9Q8Z8X2_CURCL|nr:non-ribosomal peptide synthetase [Curvularia clavata]